MTSSGQLTMPETAPATPPDIGTTDSSGKRLANRSSLDVVRKIALLPVLWAAIDVEGLRSNDIARDKRPKCDKLATHLFLPEKPDKGRQKSQAARPQGAGATPQRSRSCFFSDCETS